MKADAADKFNASTKEQKEAKIEEIRACLKSGSFVLKAKDSAKRSEAFDLLKIITDQKGNEIHCFFFCTACEKNSKNPIIFADTRNGTSKILSHHRSHKKVATVAVSADESDDDGAQSLKAESNATAKKKVEIPQKSASYVLDADTLSLLLSKMASIGHNHGVLEPDAIKKLLPQANEL